MSSDSQRRKIQQARQQIGKLQQDKAREAKKVADATRKVNSASQAIKRTKIQGTIKSKLGEIEREQKKIADAEKKSAEIETKLAREQKKISDGERDLAREIAREDRKREQEQKRAELQHQKRMSDITSKLATHDKLHDETRTAIQQLAELPEKVTVLFLASNPVDQQQLRLDEEVRSITEMIRKSEHRDSVELVSCWAVRTTDVMQALNEHTPTVVHFSGHGSDQDEIVFQDNQGNAKTVSKDAIVQTMNACSDGIRLVFFNTCYSRGQAEAAAEHVHATIGMKTSIGDEAARVFAAQFYSAIGFGLSVSKAFEQARAAVMLEGIPEEDTPELFMMDGLSADDVVIVRPPDAGSKS